jgi:hypothetical protein
MASKRRILFKHSETLTVGAIRQTYWTSFLNSLIRFTDTDFNEQSNAVVYHEPRFLYNEIPTFVNDEKVCIFGYFQSYKYFDSMKNSIFNMIRLSSHKKTVLDEYPDLIFQNYVNISMHFRLGDYKNIKDFHPLLPYYYYQEALEFMNKNIDKKCRVLYFCQKEDNTAVFEIIDQLKIIFPHIVFIKVDDDMEDWKQMLLMSCCQHNIIANSTFSWWGAYFNESTDKIVCYPDTWFGPKLLHDVSDLFEKSWTKIACSPV